MVGYPPKLAVTNSAKVEEMSRFVVATVLGFASQAAALQVGFRAPGVTAPRAAAAVMQTQVESLVSANSALIDELAKIGPDVSELTRLRFAMQFPDPAEAKAAMKENVAWRAGAGKSIVESAAKAVAEATVGGGWDNEPVRLAAPHATAINEFVSPKNILTLSTAKGDLVYVIRASGVDDKTMMSKVSVDQVVDFFLYAKEIHSLVANARSKQSGRLCNVIFANDITGTRKPPDALFGAAAWSKVLPLESMMLALVMVPDVGSHVVNALPLECLMLALAPPQGAPGSSG